MNENCCQLLQMINQASFALDDITLYLDTHPCDRDALNYYQYVKNLRQEALNAYQSQCGPMMKDMVNAGSYWSWTEGKWPWEGGR